MSVTLTPLAVHKAVNIFRQQVLQYYNTAKTLVLIEEHTKWAFWVLDFNTIGVILTQIVLF